MSTPLHAALGRVDDLLSFELIEEACHTSVVETEQIDFKRDFPLPVGPTSTEEERSRTLELAKDLAAMANGRGGMLIYGVRDESDAAAELVGVPTIGEGVMEKRIRQVAYNFVYPPVQVQCSTLQGETKRVLVVSVPESDESPHLVRPKRDGGNVGWLVAPYRSGPDTHNMVEKQLETAYQQRFEGKRRQRTSLRDLHAELGRRHIGGQDQNAGTVLALALPVRHVPPAVDANNSDRRATSIADAARYWAQELYEQLVGGDLPFPLRCFAEDLQVRRGLRRYVLTTPLRVREATAQGYVGVELHDDSTIGLVWRRGQDTTKLRNVTTFVPKPALGATDLDACNLMLLSLLLAAHDELKVGGDYQVRVCIAPETTLHLIPDDESNANAFERVEAPPAVEAELRLTGNPSIRAADMLGLAQDLSDLVGRRATVLDGFWYGIGSNPEHPRRVAARRLFGGLPNHPVTGLPI